MKSVFNKIEKEKSKEVVFPVLAEALVRDETFVVLLLSNNKGVVVKGNSYNLIGSMCSDYSLSYKNLPDGVSYLQKNLLC